MNNVVDTSYMFDNCTSLSSIDFSNANFSSVAKYENMFGGVNNNINIIAKDDTQRTWLTSKFTNLTNVVLQSEL